MKTPTTRFDFLKLILLASGVGVAIGAFVGWYLVT
jgi:hypothetical protein